MDTAADDIDEALIDLGAVSVQTQGMFPRYPELGVGAERPAGLAQD